MPDDYIFIIGGGLLQVPVVEQTHKLGYKALVTDRSPNCPCAALADIFKPIDIFDIDGHVRLGLSLRESGVSIVGVIAAGIPAPLTAAVVGEILGLIAPSPRAAYVCRHKPACRALLGAAGFATPRWREVTEDDALEALSTVGFPCIVKNTDNSASRGTTRFPKPVSDDVFMEAVRRAIAASRSRTALVEQLLRGSEHTVETLWFDGRFYPCFITDRMFASSGPYAIELGLVHPTRLPPDVQVELFDLVKRASQVLGIDVGAAKADVMITADGPYILEMTPRLSGGFDCQYLVPAATGKNVIRAALTIALGEPPDPMDLIATKFRFGRTGSVWPKPGRVVRISGVEEAREIRGVDHVFMRCKVGDEIGPYQDCASRVCFIVATGATRLEAMAALRSAQQQIRIETE